MATVKQVIVMRKDLKMRRGKEIAQGGHAATRWLISRLSESSMGLINQGGMIAEAYFSKEEREWLFGLQTKITVPVSSEQELDEIYKKAKELGLKVNLVVDAGKTEFNGVPTKTCLAIGPDDAEKIDLVTGHLTLY